MLSQSVHPPTHRIPRSVLSSLRSRVLLSLLACLFCVLASGWGHSAIAHSKGQSYLYFQIGEETLSAHTSIPITDLGEVLGLTLPDKKWLSEKDIAPDFEQMRTYVEDHISADCPPQSCELVYKSYDLEGTSSGQFLQIYYDIVGFETMPEALQVSNDVILADNADFTNFVLVDQDWKTGTFNAEANIVLTYDKAGKVQALDLTDGGLFQGFSAIVKLGVIHILEGPDHVLFLIALLLPSVVRRVPDDKEGEGRQWVPVSKFKTAFYYIIKLATAFTVAHSITLGLATLQIVDLPSRFVESVIAASIGLAAVDIFYPIFQKRIWLVIFAFGLFHGFGFASVLADLGVTSQHALLSLFAFNLGVELGQLAIIAVIFPILYFLRKQLFYTPLVLKTGGLLLGAMSLYWLIERVFDINIRVLPVLQGLF